MEGWARWKADVNRRFGRKQGWVRHQLASWANLLGRFDRLEAIDFTVVERLVFVCQGNICRSAYAEARARSLGIAAASFGLRARRGDRANRSAVRAADRRGIDLRRHRAHGREDLLLAPSDLLVAMEPWHAERLAERAAIEGAQLTLLGLWAHERRPHLEDPYGLNDGYFDTCFGIIDDAVAALARVMRRPA